MKYPKLRELKEAVKALIKGPYTSQFPRKPHIPPERSRGRPEFHEEHCMGCTACAQVCPSRVIDFEDRVEGGKAKRVLTVNWDICIFCGQCQANCPTEKGIVLSNDFDLATTGSRKELKQTIEKEMILCDCCGEIIAPYDQILWVAKKLGPLCFSNTSLIQFYLEHIDIISLDRQRVKEEELTFERSDRIKILCPRCRRETVIKS